MSGSGKRAEQCRAIASPLIALGGALGLLNLLGWLFDISVLIRLFEDLPEMSGITAAVMLIIAGTLWMLRHPPARPLSLRRRIAAATAGFTALLIGLIPIAEYMLPAGSFPDLLSAQDHLWVWGDNISPHRSVMLIFFGLALICFDIESDSDHRPAQMPLVGVLFMAFLALLGYTFDLFMFYGTSRGEGLSLQTAVGMLALSSAALLLRPDRGFIRIAMADSLGGLMVRHLSVVMFFGILLLSCFSLAALRLGLYRENLAIPIFATSVLFLLVIGVVLYAQFINRIDERRRSAEAALRGEQSRLQLAMEAGKMGHWEWDFATGMITWSPGLEKIHGFAPGTFPGTMEAFMEDVHPADRERVKQVIEENIRLKRDHHVEYRIIVPGGDLRWVEGRGKVELDGRGGVTRLAGICSDITERKRSEITLRESEERFRTMADAAPVLIWMSGKDKGFSYFNKTWLEFTGRPMEQELGTGWTTGIHPEDHERCLDIYLKSFELGVPFRMEYRLRRHDGAYRWVMDNGIPRFSADGTLQGYIGSCVDVTENREFAQELKVSEERFRTALKSVPIIVFQQDRNLRFTWSHSSFPEISRPLGRRDDEVLERAADWEMTMSIKRRVIESGAGERREITLLVNGVERTFDLTVEPIKDGAGRVVGVTCAAFDITRRKHEEEERRNLELQMQQSQKLESLGLLAGGIAHDFNNLLVGILGNATLMKESVSFDPDQHDALKDIEKAARHAADLCQQMLAYSGRGRFLVEPLNLNDVVREIADLLRVSISKKARLIFDFASVAPTIEGDVTQVRQVVMNLITNASEALGSEDGIIRIATGMRQLETGLPQGGLDIPPLPPGEYAFLEVSDTGVGMDEETVQKIFDPFYTTKFTGRGLGLAAVQGIVRGHGGAIQVRSARGEGTTFTIYFHATSSTGNRRLESTPLPLAWRGNGTVLLVDDVETVRLVGRRLLERRGFTVLTAANGAEALEILRQSTPSVDCVVLDLAMPVMDGVETYQHLRRMNASIPVILSSGYNEQEAVNRFDAKGLAGFIQKPYDAQALVSMIRSAIDQAAAEQRKKAEKERPVDELTPTGLPERTL